MDAINDPAIETIVFMKSAQVGATELILNVIGYIMHQDPSPLMVVVPNMHESGMTFSKDRLSPMIRDSPALKALVEEPKSRDSGNTIFHKQFVGGHITIASASAPASLASRPIRILLCDETDRYKMSAGTEGDPIDLATKRTNSFLGRRKIVLASTPGDESTSRIYEAWKQSDQRHYFVPCPLCGSFQALEWGEGKTFGLKFDRDEEKSLIAASICYRCADCSGDIQESDKQTMLEAGDWEATAAGDGQTAGFHINEIYSPLSRWENIVRGFLKAKGNRERMKVWVNTSLGIPFKDERKTIDHTWLFGRREKYNAQVPRDGLVLVAGCDVGIDHIHVDVRAWGKGLQNWGIEYRILYGDPARPEIWRDLAGFLLGSWEHESGARLQIAAAGIDSGYLTEYVYAFCKRYKANRFWAVKGDSGTAATPLFRISARRSGRNRRPVELTIVGGDASKSMSWALLNIVEPGPGCCHWPISEDYGPKYFEQLTGEAVKPQLRNGREVRRWVQVADRVEAWDCFNYGLAIVHRLNPLWDVIDARLNSPDESDPEPEPRKSITPVRPRRRRWMDGAK